MHIFSTQNYPRNMNLYKILKFFGYLVLLINIADCGDIEWGIEDEDIRSLGFSFKEYKIDTSVNTVLARYNVTNVSSAWLIKENNFIDVKITKDKRQIEIVLLEELAKYREESWAASLEIQYMLVCASSPGNNSSESTKAFTFLLIIEDCNIYAPDFDEKENVIINVSMPQPKENILNQNHKITITDRDINKAYGTVNVSCIQVEDSESCENFKISTTDISDSSHNGYKYSVNISLHPNSSINNPKNINEGDSFKIALLASDSNKNGTKLIEFRVIEKLELGGGSSAESGSNNTLAMAIGIGVGSIAILVTIAFSYTTWRNRQTKNILRKLTEAEIREFLEGTTGFSGGYLPKRSIDCNTPILAMPYNKAFEIPRDRLRIDETTVLGSGFFGVVMKGTVLHENGENTTVAVKAVKRNVGILYFKALLSELKIMAFIGKHNNIVGLVGASTHNIRKREVYIAVEYCSNGNLNNYLRTYRDSFVNFVQDGKLCGIRRDSYARKDSYSKRISTLDLIKWATQISNGLEYLSSLGVIHGDLATRNILLTSTRISKIADFGLSRRLVDVSSYYYTKQTQVPMPWKWMAIESLKDMKFSPKSDIYSFGIVLWEIFSLGQTPYPGLNWEETFVERLEKGLRLPQPVYASVDLYDIMKDCWNNDPFHRPDASTIKRQLESMTNTLLIQNPADSGYFRVLGEEKSVYISDTTVETGVSKPKYVINNKQADC